MKAVVALVCSFSGIAFAQQVPGWAKDLPNLPVMPGFYQGLGLTRVSADPDADWKQAAGQARSQISSQIKVRVVNAVSRKIQEVSSRSDLSLEEAFSSTTDQVTAITLENLEVHRWIDTREDILYAYAAISREEVEQRFRENMEAAVSKARVYHSAAQRALEKGDVYFALLQYIEAAQAVFLSELYLDKVLIGDLESSGGNQPLLPMLQNDFCVLLRQVNFKSVSGDNQAAERGRTLSEPLIGKLTRESPTGSTPMNNSVLTASFVPPTVGTMTKELRTDDQGLFRIEITEIRSGQATNKVRVRLDMKALEMLARQLPEALKCWESSFFEFTLRMKSRTNVSIVMRILESNLGQPKSRSRVQQVIQDRLIGDKYVLLDESQANNVLPREKMDMAISTGDFNNAIAAFASSADLLVLGTVTTSERSNPTKGMYFSTGSAAIHIVDAKTGRIVGGVNVDNQKEGGASFEVAGMKVIERMAQHIGEEIKKYIDAALQ